ncbi:MAG: PhnD/SsuA/transferrin family substrate-binding protein [Cyanobacteria bacterium P01_F01_bin.53]
MRIRHFVLSVMMMGVVGCADVDTQSTDKMTIGVVSYGESEVSLEQYQRFQNYLAEQTKIAFELEVAYNELQAVQQVESGNWSLVFAPPGLAVIAGKRGYSQLFTLDDADKSEHSLMVVPTGSSIETLTDLAYKTVGMGEPGSAAGYYLPLYNLYGLTLEKVQFAPTPKQLLSWVEDGTVAAGAISEKDFEQYKGQFPGSPFRVIHQSKRNIPSGVVLLGVVERGQGEFVKRVMQDAPSNITSDARYVPSAPLPNYGDMVKVVERVKPLETQVKKAPAILTLEHLDSKETPSEAAPSEAVQGAGETVPGNN